MVVVFSGYKAWQTKAVFFPPPEEFRIGNQEMLMAETLASIDGGAEKHRGTEYIHQELSVELKNLANSKEYYNDRKNAVDSTKHDADKYPFSFLEPILVFKGYVGAEESYGPGYLNLINNETFYVTSLGNWKREAGYYYPLDAIMPMSAYKDSKE